MSSDVLYHTLLHASSRCGAVPPFYTAPFCRVHRDLAKARVVQRALTRFIAECIHQYVVYGRKENGIFL
jgi:hypothetical protein